MHGSKLPLMTWGMALYILTTNIKGTSSMKLHRDLGYHSEDRLASSASHPQGLGDGRRGYPSLALSRWTRLTSAARSATSTSQSA